MFYGRLTQVADQLSARGASLFAVAAPGGQRPRWTVAGLAALVLIAVLRFWGVGSYSLHKPDEDTTALAAVHILEDGTPRFPSGMFYARAIAQSYMIAASVMAFGQTEWALRLPSVLCGVLLVVLAYWMGLRFLSPVWNLAFTASVAFLPGLIADSQEARMYIFMIASLACYAGLVFAWERSGRHTFLVAAVAVMLLGIQFQPLVLFGSLVVLLPGLLRDDRARMLQGAAALAAVGLGYLLISRWTGSFYPSAAADYAAAAVPQLGQAPLSVEIRVRVLFGAVAAVAGAGLAWFVTSRMRPGSPRAAVRTLVWLGLVSQAALYYHIAVLLFLIALIVARRSGALPRRHVVAVFLACALLALVHVIVLHAAGISSPRKVVGILIGRPSIWQYLMLGSYSAVAATVTLLSLAHAGWQLANRRPIADYWLFFLLAVGLPLFAVGLFGWYFPARYVEFALLPFLLTAFACCQQWMLATRAGEAGWLKPVIAAAASATIVGPAAAARAVNAGDTFADHRAAAQFMRSIARGPKDIVIAEEVLMQTYYLGHVDYWLQDPTFAAPFVIRLHGSFVDEYTNTPVIDTAAALEALLAKSDRGAVYVIGSGENFDGRQRPMRPQDVDYLLHSNSFMPVFVARDGLTTIWRAAPPAKGPDAN
jgi:hypothetical protein